MASNRNPKILERLELSQRLADQDVENNRRYWAEQAARQKAPAASASKPKSANTAFTRSGADRDTYDSRVRSNYYARQNAFSQRSGAGRTQVRQNQAREEQRRTLEQERTELTQQLRAARRGNTGLNAFRREGGGERYIQRLQTRLEEVERALEERSAVPEYRLPPIGGELSGEDLAAYLTDPRFRAETERTAGLFSGNTQAENLAYLSQQEEDALAKLAREMAYDELEAEYEALSRPLNQRRQAEESEATRRSAGEHPFLGTLYSALTSPRAAQAYTDTLWRVATGRSDTVDPNSEAFRWARASADSAQGVAEAGTRMPVLGGIEVDGQNLGSFVAETGVSIAQNLARLPMGAVGALISMGGSAAGARTVEALDQGLSPEQAAASATAAGVIEAATEKIGLDRLFRVAGTAGRDGVRELVKNALKQAGVEGTEEVVSNVANQIAEIATLGEDSAYGRRVAELTGQGMDRAEAQRQAAWELFGAESLWSFAGGALSGGVMGAGADVLGRIRGRAPAQESRDPQAGAVEALARAMAEEQAAAEPPNMPEPSVEPAPPQAAPQTDTRALNPAIRTRAGEVLNEGVFTGRYAPAFEASGLSYSEIESALTALSRGEETGENTAAETVARILAENAPSPQASDPVEALAQAMAAETAEQARARSEEVRARNRRQVEENADVFGARGREALMANYDGEAVPADYYGGFAAAYHAGLTGADPGRERRGYGARLTGAQRQAAYEAGRADAAASLEEQQRAAAFAPTAGTESGLEYDAEDGASPALTAETVKKINTVAKALGVRVRFAGQVRGGTANAALQGSEVLIEKDNPNPVLFLLGHEWTHRLQELAPGEYRKFRDFAAGELQMETQVMLDAYRAAGEALSYEGALDEAAANYAGRMIEDGAVLDAFIERHRTDRTLLEKVRDAIRTLVRKLTGAERRQAKTAEGRLTKALEAAARQAGANTRAQTNAAQRGGAGAGPRFSLGQEEGVARPGQEGYTESEAETPGEEGRPYERELHAESAEQFRRRMDQADETVSERASGGYRIGGRLLDFGRSEEGQPVSRYQEARRAQRELSALGIDSQVYAGAVEINRDGETLRMEVPESTTLFRDLVLIQAELSTDPVETAGHEAFHMWARTEAGKRYQDQLLDEVKWSSPILREKMQWLEEHYGESHIMEELAAYLSGEFHAGNNEAELRQILLDYDAVKAAWEALVEKEVAEHGAGQLHPEERGQTVQQVQTSSGENRQLQGVSGMDTGRGAIQQQLPGLRTERGDEAERTSLKGTAIDRELNEQIQQMVQEAQESGKSEAEVQADVRALVQASYEQMLQTYGSIPAGERPAREVRVPRKTGEKRKVSQTVRTVLEAQATPEAAVPKLEELAARGVFSYEAYGDRQAIEDAEGMIRDKGYATALSDWTNRVRRGEVSKTNTAEGWALYNEAANSGDVKSAMTILTNMVEHQRSAAQAVQATRILKQLSPDAQLYGAARSVRNLQEELTRKYGRNAPDLKIDEELAGRFLAAKTQKARDEAMQELYRDIGRQMPSRFVDKWNAWRYLAMLGNPRTHVRNVAGNLFFMPVVAAKDATATAIEAAAARVSGGRMGRSKGLVGLGKQGRALLSAAWADFANVEEQILGSGKYSDSANANRYIQEGRVIFRNKALEAARRGNSAALDLEDTWFSKPHYAYALAQYAKANGLTPGRLRSGKGLDAARAYAIREARKATYRDTNAFSQMISGLGRYQGSNPAKKAASVVLEGILPFRKTPANILVRGVEYSPLGLLKSLTYDLVQVRAGEMTAAEAIDGIAAGLTGTGLMALGVLLAAEGLVRGSGGGDDDENQYEELMGHQAYSLEVGGKSYTLDWLAPEALPFFVGVNLWEQSGAEHEAPTLSTMINAIGNVTEPLLEMSCLQSLNEVFDAVGYATSEGLGALPSALASAATSYLTQAVPTILGQAERTSQGERMTTYTEKNAFLTQDMQYTLGSVSGRVPGWDYQQIPYIDAWGRTEPTGGPLERAADNFLNPGYRSAIQESAVEQALQELYEQTGEASVLPSRAGKYFTVDGERKDLTAEEYVEYATARGQTAYVLMDELFQRTEGTGLSDEDLVNAVEQVYEYANAQAKTQVSDYEPDGWVKKAMEGREAGVGTVDYILYRLACEMANDQNQDPEKRNQSIDQEEAREAAAMVPGLSDAARAYLWQSTNKQWKEKNNPWRWAK